MRAPRPRRARRWLAAAVLLLAAAAVAGGVRAWRAWRAPAEAVGREVVVRIPQGATLVRAAEALREAGVIRSLRAFVLEGKLRGLSGSVQAGEFAFRTDMTPEQVLLVLTRGRPVSYPVTVPEGFSVLQIADLLAQKGLARRDRLLSLSEDPAFARSLGVPAPRLEGFLFPDTYSWPRGLPEEEILGAMVRRFRSVFDEAMRRRAASRGMSELQAVTLASIVEKETGEPSERRQVAAVFHNRLRKGYRLQADPTVIYGLRDFDGNLTRRHLQTDHPYNTYTRAGLPAGPIANPGRASLEAAVDPAPTSDLYFVARGDGTHVFSSTLVDHNQAVRTYQQEGGAR